MAKGQHAVRGEMAPDVIVVCVAPLNGGNGGANLKRGVIYGVTRPGRRAMAVRRQCQSLLEASSQGNSPAAGGGQASKKERARPAILSCVAYGRGKSCQLLIKAMAASRIMPIDNVA